MENRNFDVFLSYSRDDKSEVEELANRLREKGINPWLDQWNVIPGTHWQPEIESALSECNTCAVVVGKTGLGPWQHEEMRAAIQRRVNESDGRFRVIPVLLPGASRNGSRALPAFLVAASWVEFANTLNDKDAFHRLVSGIRGVRPGPARRRGITRSEYVFVLTGKANEITKPKIEAIRDHLREITGDATLTIKKVEPGSVRLTVESSFESFEKLRTLIERGALANILDMEIVEFRRVDEVFGQKPVESTSTQSIQDGILNAARKDKLQVTIYLLSGVKLMGRIRSFDRYSVILETLNQDQLIFKHAISTVVMSKQGHRNKTSPETIVAPALKELAEIEGECE